MHRAVFLVVSWYLSASSANPLTGNVDSDPTSALDHTSPWSHGPDISHCIHSSQPNPWRDLPVSPNPFPDLSPVGRNSGESINSVGGGGVANNSAPSSDFASIPQNDEKDRMCRQVARHRFDQVTGYVRTRDFDISDPTVHFWLSWATDFAIKVVVWRSQYEVGPWYFKFYTSPIGGERIGGLAIVAKGRWNRIRVDLQLPEGDGAGTSGEVVLFELNYPLRPQFSMAPSP